MHTPLVNRLNVDAKLVKQMYFEFKSRSKGEFSRFSFDHVNVFKPNENFSKISRAYDMNLCFKLLMLCNKPTTKRCLQNIYCINSFHNVDYYKIYIVSTLVILINVIKSLPGWVLFINGDTAYPPGKSPAGLITLSLKA